MKIPSIMCVVDAVNDEDWLPGSVSWVDIVFIRCLTNAEASPKTPTLSDTR